MHSEHLAHLTGDAHEPTTFRGKERDMKCEVAGCAASAVVRITDTQELEPIADQDGQLWENRVPHSLHWLCAAHRRQPIRYPKVTPAEVAAVLHPPPAEATPP